MTVAEEKSIQTRVHEALEKHAGVGSLHRARQLAADELGMTLEEIKTKIKESPSLRERWAKPEVEVPDEIDTISRGVTVDDERMAAAIKREDERLKKGLQAIGLTPRELEETLALQKFNRDNFASSLDIINAGVTRTAVRLMTHLQQIDARLEIVRFKLIQMGDNMHEDRDLWVNEERTLAEEYRDAVDQLRKILATSFEGQKILALVRAKIAQKGQRKIKPQFQEIGQNVEIEVQQ